MTNRYRKRHTRTTTPSASTTTTTTRTTNKLAWSSRRPTPARRFQQATRTTPRTTKTMASSMRPKPRLCSNDQSVEKRNDQEDRESNEGVLTNNITAVSSPERKGTVLRSCYRLKLEYHDDDNNNNDDDSNNVSVEAHLQSLQLVDKDDTNSDSSRTTSLSFTSSSSASSSNQYTTRRGRNPTVSSPWRRPKKNKNKTNTTKAHRGRTPQSVAPVMNLHLRTAIEASRIFQGLVVGKNGTILQQNSRANRTRLGTTIEAGQSRQALEIEQILATACTCTNPGTARTTSSNPNGARNDIGVEYNRKYTGPTATPMVGSGVTATTKNTNRTATTNTNYRREDELLLVERQYDSMQQLIEEGLRRNYTTRTRFVRNTDALLRVL